MIWFAGMSGSDAVGHDVIREGSRGTWTLPAFRNCCRELLSRGRRWHEWLVPRRGRLAQGDGVNDSSLSCCADCPNVAAVFGCLIPSGIIEVYAVRGH